METDREKYFSSSEERKIDRRRSEPGTRVRRTFEVQTLWQQHHEIVRRRLLGQKVVDIAAAMGVTREMVSYTLSSPAVKEKLEVMRGAVDAATVDVATQIANLAPRAVAVMEELLESDRFQWKYAAAKDILDRAGHGPVKKIDARVTTAVLDRETLEELKQRRTDAARAKADIVDVEFEETRDAFVNV